MVLSEFGFSYVSYQVDSIGRKPCLSKTELILSETTFFPKVQIIHSNNLRGLYIWKAYWSVGLDTLGKCFKGFVGYTIQGRSFIFGYFLRSFKDLFLPCHWNFNEVYMDNSKVSGVQIFLEMSNHFV